MTSSTAPELRWVSDAALRVALADPAEALSDASHARVQEAYARLRAAAVPGLRDLTPAFGTILVAFDLARLDASRAEETVRAALADLPPAPSSPSRVVEIPVCYEGDCAPDLADVARCHGTTAAEVVALHAGGAYVVRFLGFSPGFPYLAGMPDRIATPRRDVPRVRVPAGSVGIAGAQTGVYPQETPGGWQLIGRTPLRLFDARRVPPALLAMGDGVRFVPIARDEFERRSASARQ